MMVNNEIQLKTQIQNLESQKKTINEDIGKKKWNDSVHIWCNVKST